MQSPANTDLMHPKLNNRKCVTQVIDMQLASWFNLHASLERRH
jgi:hypothetical protein